MEEKIICFSLGLSAADVDRGKASYSEANKEAARLEVIAVTEAMLDLPVGEVMSGIAANERLKNSGNMAAADIFAGPAGFKYKVVVVNTMERQQVLQVMRSFKDVLPDPRNIIFAVITDTARTWTFGEYIGHLAREHEQMLKH